MRVVLDTNAFLRGLFRPSSAAGRILRLIATGVLTLVTSEPLIAELTEVLARPSVRRKIPTPDDASAELLGFIREVAGFVEITGILQMCRDPKDDMLIETAIVGQAAAQISEDKDILVLTLPNCRTLTVIDFLRWIESDGHGYN